MWGAPKCGGPGAQAPVAPPLIRRWTTKIKATLYNYIGLQGRSDWDDTKKSGKIMKQSGKKSGKNYTKMREIWDIASWKINKIKWR